jgi:hypothetical protein
MTAWDVLNNVVTGFPYVITALFSLATLAGVVLFIAGFTRHGIDFVKHGFNQHFNEELLSKLATKDDIAKLDAEISGVKSELAFIKANHFGHLKNYLGVLNGILLDKGIIDNEGRARLDNELRGM